MSALPETRASSWPPERLPCANADIKGAELFDISQLHGIKWQVASHFQTQRIQLET